MSRKVNYFEAQRTVNDQGRYSLANVVCSVLGSTLSAIETRKSRSFWVDAAAFSSGYNLLSEQQWWLLMNSADEIKLEIRALRNGALTPQEARDPQANPFDLELATLLGINLTLTDASGRDVATILSAIEAKLGTEEEREEGLALLRTIAGLLAAL